MPKKRVSHELDYSTLQFQQKAEPTTPRFLANAKTAIAAIYSGSKDQAKGESENPPAELSQSKQGIFVAKEQDPASVLSPSKFGKKLVLPLHAINFKLDKYQQQTQQDLQILKICFENKLEKIHEDYQQIGPNTRIPFSVDTPKRSILNSERSARKSSPRAWRASDSQEPEESRVSVTQLPTRRRTNELRNSLTITLQESARSTRLNSGDQNAGPSQFSPTANQSIK